MFASKKNHLRHIQKERRILCYILLAVMLATMLSEIAAAGIDLSIVLQPDSQKASSGETLKPSAMTEHTTPESGESFNSLTPFTKSYSIRYYDAEGNLFHEEWVNEGSLASAPPNYPSKEGMIFEGWFVQGETEPFSFGSTTINSDMILYSVFSGSNTEETPDGSTGSENPASGEDSTGATDSMAGEEKNENQQDGTTSALTSSSATSTLEGIMPMGGTNTINYTVSIWVEKANIAYPQTPIDPSAGNRSDYDLHYSTTLTGNIGEMVTYTKSTASSLVTSIGNSDLTKLLTYCDFAYSDKKAISGYGDTVINIYFNRMVFELTFDVTKYYPGSTLANYNPPGVGEIFVNDTSSPGNLVSVGSVYTIHIKLEQITGDIWPQKVDMPNGLNFANWSGYYGLGTYRIDYSAIAVTFSSATPPPASLNYTVKAPVRTSYTLYPKTINNPLTEQRKFYVELTEEELAHYLIHGSLPGGEDVKIWTTSHATYPGTRYYKFARQGAINNQGNVSASSVLGWPGIAIDGFETIGSNSSSSVCKTKNFQERIATPTGTTPTIYLYYYMPRKTYPVRLVTHGGTLTAADLSNFSGGSGVYTSKASIAYEKPVTIAPTAVDRFGYDFEGWYYDEYYTVAFNTGDAMPSRALSLYAKYRSLDTSLRFEYVPAMLPFGTVTFSLAPQTIQRKDLSWHIRVYDGRGAGSTWRITASLSDHLTATDGSGEILPNALVMVSSGSSTPIPVVGTGECNVYSGTTVGLPGETDAYTIINFTNSEGPLLQIAPGQGTAGKTYQTDIIWTLYDAP